MRLFSIVLLAAGLLWLADIQPAQGQLVRITPNGFGGVNIRAPFVRINTTPYGPSHVRAPFVNVNPGAPYYAPPQPYYAQPVPYGNAAPGYGAPGQVMYESTNPGSSVLQPGMSSETAPSSPPNSGVNRPRPQPSGQPVSSSPPTRTTPTSAADDAAENASDAPAPAPAPEPELRSVLDRQPLSAEQVAELRGNLINSSRELDQSLTQYSNAQAWQDHLRLPEFIVDESQPLDEISMTDEQAEQLELVVRRFNRTAERADLQLVNKFESFRRTHQYLLQVARQLNDPSPLPVEELPTPTEGDQ